MKTPAFAFVLAFLMFTSPSGARAADFVSGSTGADGALNITAGVKTLDLPPDGIFNFTTITIGQGAQLQFTRNELNTPAYLLASGDVVINGLISLNGGNGTASSAGEGGPGGFDGGNPAFGDGPPGDGYGPGGGQGNANHNATDADLHTAAAHATSTTSSSTNVYGTSLLQPLVGGSGGGGTVGVNGRFSGMSGGGGGGALLIASTTQINISPIGAIYSNGGTTPTGIGGGSGGAIRLVAPHVLGSGRLGAPGNAGGGMGRIRVDTIDRSQMQFVVSSGKLSIGRNMSVFPISNPRLDFIEVAGKSIPFGTNATVYLTLGLNAPSQQTVKLLALGFVGQFNVEVVVTPESGPALKFPALIDMAGSDRVTNTVNVTIPGGVQCRVEAWSR